MPQMRRQCIPVRLDQDLNHNPRLIFKARPLLVQLHQTPVLYSRPGLYLRPGLYSRKYSILTCNVLLWMPAVYIYVACCRSYYYYIFLIYGQYLVNAHFGDIPHIFIPHFTLHSAEKICIKFFANYPLATFRIPQNTPSRDRAHYTNNRKHLSVGQ